MGFGFRDAYESQHPVVLTTSVLNPNPLRIPDNEPKKLKVKLGVVDFTFLHALVVVTGMHVGRIILPFTHFGRTVLQRKVLFVVFGVVFHGLTVVFGRHLGFLGLRVVATGFLDGLTHFGFVVVLLGFHTGFDDVVLVGFSVVLLGFHTGFDEVGLVGLTAVFLGFQAGFDVAGLVGFTAGLLGFHARLVGFTVVFFGFHAGFDVAGLAGFTVGLLGFHAGFAVVDLVHFGFAVGSDGLPVRFVVVFGFRLGFRVGFGVLSVEGTQSSNNCSFTAFFFFVVDLAANLAGIAFFGYPAEMFQI